MKLPQVSLRDFFWLVLVAGILTSWGIDHQRSALQIEKLTKQTYPLISPPLGRIIISDEEELSLDLKSP
jgi:hypothetical protein